MLDQAAISRLRQSPQVHEDSVLHEAEHSLEIQLPFLQQVLEPGWRLVPILLSAMQPSDYLEAAQALRPLLDDTTLLVVSSDFTHYGPRFQYLPFPPDKQIAARIRELDMGAFARIEAKDPQGFLNYYHETGITVCGYRAVTLLLHLLSQEAKVRLLEYATSGELTGDYRHSVSYIGAVVTEMEQQGDDTPADDAAQGVSDRHLKYLHELAELTIRARFLGNPKDLERLRLRVEKAPEETKRKGAALSARVTPGVSKRC
jgi:hypothetical protein